MDGTPSGEHRNKWMEQLLENIETNGNNTFCRTTGVCRLTFKGDYNLDKATNDYNHRWGQERK
jgi:hypothetical protein